MRRLRRGGIALALLLGLATPILAGDQDSPSGSNWLTNMFGPKDKPTDNRPTTAGADPVVRLDVGESDRSQSPAASADGAAALREREMATYLRRIQVCDKLKQFAMDANDMEQLRRIEQLEERVGRIYQKRTASLSGSAPRTGTDNANLGGNR